MDADFSFPRNSGLETTSRLYGVVDETPGGAAA